MFIQAYIEAKNLDEPISRKEFNDLKIVVSDLKIIVEALLKKSNQETSSSIKRKEKDDSKGKQFLFLKILRSNVIYLM